MAKLENAIALAAVERHENLLADFYERLADPTLKEDIAARASEHNRFTLAQNESQQIIEAVG